MGKLVIGKKYSEEVVLLVKKEEISIDMCIYEMFHGNNVKDNNVNDLMQKILRRMTQGVKVRLVMNTTLANPKNKENMQMFKANIDLAGGQVVEIKKGKLMHAKAIQFGKKYILVGSHNMSDRSFRSDYEISVGTEDEEINKNFSQWFDTFFV